MTTTIGTWKLPTLDDFSQGTDNNLTLLRAVAAISVALSHSYLTVTGEPGSRPLISQTGFSIGYHAVNIFFFVSGVLVTQSWSRRSSVMSFTVARGLRVFPALVICILLTTAFLGVMMTSLSSADYFLSAGTIKYLLLTPSLISPSGELPGVFTQNPDPSTINGSLWTLRYELLCYAALAVAGYMRLFSRPRVFLGISLAIGLVLVIFSTMPIVHDNTIAVGHIVRFGFCFGLGVMAFQYRKFLPVHWSGVLVLLILVVMARDTIAHLSVLYLTTAYTTLWLAYVPSGRIRYFNKAGDYSYGIYIYAYPIQQSLINLFPNLVPEQMFVLTLLATLPLAISSWHLVEKPALRAKGRISKKFPK